MNSFDILEKKEQNQTNSCAATEHSTHGYFLIAIEFLKWIFWYYRNLEERIEHFVPGSDMSELKDMLLLSKNYITRLKIKQLLPPVREAPKPFQLDDDDTASDAGAVYQRSIIKVEGLHWNFVTHSLLEKLWVSGFWFARVQW